MRANLFSFSFHHQKVSLKPHSSCSRLFLRRSVTSILPSILPSITCFRRQFLCNVWPINLACLLFTIGKIFVSFLILFKTIYMDRHNCGQKILKFSKYEILKIIYLLWFILWTAVIFIIVIIVNIQYVTHWRIFGFSPINTGNGGVKQMIYIIVCSLMREWQITKYLGAVLKYYFILIK